MFLVAQKRDNIAIMREKIKSPNWENIRDKYVSKFKEIITVKAK